MGDKYSNKAILCCQLRLTKLVSGCAEFLVFLPSVLSFFPSLLSLSLSLSLAPVFLIALFLFLSFPLHLDFFPCYFSLISGTNHSSLPLQILCQRFLV